MTYQQARIFVIGLCAVLGLCISIAMQISDSKPTDMADWLRIGCWAVVVAIAGFFAGVAITDDQ